MVLTGSSETALRCRFVLFIKCAWQKQGVSFDDPKRKMGLRLTQNIQAVKSALDEVSAGLHKIACKDTHHRHMTEVVVVHHFHDLQHTVVGGHSHQPRSWGHDLTHMNTC